MLKAVTQRVRTWTLQRLEQIGIVWVGWPDARMPPAWENGPAAPSDGGDEQEDWARRGDWLDGAATSQAAQRRAAPVSPGLTAAVWEAREAEVEAGSRPQQQLPGGDIDADGRLWRTHPHLPDRMDVLSAWLRLRERVQRGELGGADDSGEPIRPSA
jgi:hypothetical protein